MPKSTMTEQADWRLPAETPFPAVLVAVKTKTINWNDKETGESKSRDQWVWEFQIEEGQYAGLSAWGETEDRITSKSNNVARQWAETLRGAQFEIGEGLDTDDLLGIRCIITVANLVVKKKDGTDAYTCPVNDVFPADALVAQTADPPF